MRLESNRVFGLFSCLHFQFICFHYDYQEAFGLRKHVFVFILFPIFKSLNNKMFSISRGINEKLFPVQTFEKQEALKIMKSFFFFFTNSYSNF